jgi:hypothetical protein
MTCENVTEKDGSEAEINEKRMHDIAVAVGLMVGDCTLKPDLEDLLLGAKSLRSRFENVGVDMEGLRCEIEQLRATIAKQAAELKRLRKFENDARDADHAMTDKGKASMLTVALADLDKASKEESR